MAPTLTYDTSDDPQAIAEAEARDQESLEIGEQLEQEQSNLLAGKYRDAEELEQAYIELQKKLGSRSTDEAPEEEAEQEEPEEEDDSPTIIDELIESARTGEFTEEGLAAFDNMSPQEKADLLHAIAQENKQEERSELEEQDIQSMKNLVGGEEQYSQLIRWASENLNQNEIEIYDSVMDRGDPAAIYFAIQALNYRYQDSVGTEGRLLTGKAAQVSDVFRSQAEVVRAMNDPRYESDPAYRQDIFNKLERSNLDF